MVFSSIPYLKKIKKKLSKKGKKKWIEPLALQKIQTSFDEKYGENTIIINKVVIGNADFDESYNNAVAEKQNAQLAYEILTNSLSKDIFTQMMLEKWNGELPKVVGEGNAIFDISSMLNIQEQQE